MSRIATPNALSEGMAYLAMACRLASVLCRWSHSIADPTSSSTHGALPGEAFPRRGTAFDDEPDPVVAFFSPRAFITLILPVRGKPAPKKNGFNIQVADAEPCRKNGDTGVRTSSNWAP